MIKLFLISYLLQSVLTTKPNHNCIVADYNIAPPLALVPAHVPFPCEAAAKKWVDEVYCGASERFFSIPLNEIDQCWGNILSHPRLVMIVDGYEYDKWQDWSDVVTKARAFMLYLRVRHCTMVDWGSDFVHINQTLDIGFNITVLRPDQKRVTLTSRLELTFATESGERNGIYLRYNHTSESSFTGLILGFFAVLQQFVGVKVPEIIAGLLSSVIVNHDWLVEFLVRTNIGVIMFLVVMMMVIYMVLYAVIRVSKFCLKKCGLFS